MWSTHYGLVVLIFFINTELAQADKTEESLMNMAHSTRSLWENNEYSDVNDYDYDDDDIMETLERKERANQPPGVWGKRGNAPPGVWGRRERQPPGVWGKRSKQPPGVWGKRSGYLKRNDKSSHERWMPIQSNVRKSGFYVERGIKNSDREGTIGNKDLLAMARYIDRKHTLERKKLAIIDKIRRLKDALDDEN